MKKSLLTILPALISANLFAHGYVSSPESRADMCSLHENNNCGAIQYEPQSLEGHTNDFITGLMDNQMGSAENTRFADLDSQSSDRWSKSQISAGDHTFDWTFTANHKTSSFKFYITKQDWNPNKPLTISEFDTKAFCVKDWDASQPPKKLTIDCIGSEGIPNRSGYQVIMAAWDVADTVNSFYNLIDVDFG